MYKQVQGWDRFSIILIAGYFTLIASCTYWLKLNIINLPPPASHIITLLTQLISRRKDAHNVNTNTRSCPPGCQKIGLLDDPLKAPGIMCGTSDHPQTRLGGRGSQIRTRVPCPVKKYIIILHEKGPFFVMEIYSEREFHLRFFHHCPWSLLNQ